MVEWQYSYRFIKDGTKGGGVAKTLREAIRVTSIVAKKGLIYGGAEIEIRRDTGDGCPRLVHKSETFGLGGK